MSGHSKWHNIQARKGKQDALRSSQFTKVGKTITIAAKTGGGDANTNFSLRLAIEKAKEVGMPKENIERAIKRGAGELSDGAPVEEVLYEAYGPGGVALLIKALTDNKNRAVAAIKHLLSKYGGSMGSSGSVMWMFEKCGLIIVPGQQFLANSVNQEEIEMKMIEAGADDIWEEAGLIYFKVKSENFKKALDIIKSVGLEPARAGIEWVAKDKAQVSGDHEAALKKLFEEFENNDDIDDFYTNAE